MSRTSEHVQILFAGPRAWNHWRETNPTQIPDLKSIRPTLNQRQMGSVNGGPVNLKGALLQDSFLRYATLSHADLTDANLTDADLAYARLDNASLKGANLTNAVLDQTDFSNAVLNGVIIRGASLKQALNLTQEQINRCIGDGITALPEHIERPASWSNIARPSKSVQPASENIPPDIEFSRVSPLGSRKIKIIGVVLVLVPLLALVWNFLENHGTAPSISATAVKPADVPPSEMATPDASSVIAPAETAALPPGPVEWMSETVHGDHAISNVDSVHFEETHAIAGWGVQPEIPELHNVPAVAVVPLGPEMLVPSTTTPDALPSGPTIPQPTLPAPELQQKETNIPGGTTPSMKTKKTKTVAKPVPVAKNNKQVGEAISDLLAGGL